MTTTTLHKVAWIRNPEAPAGQPAPGHLHCPCGNAPESNYKPGPDVLCNCGRRYTWDGWLKGRSTGSETLTAYRVVLSNPSKSYNTCMAADVTLTEAQRYFVGRVINDSLCIDVEPC